VENRFRVLLDEGDEAGSRRWEIWVAVVRGKLDAERPEGILDWLEQAAAGPEGGLRFVDRTETATWFGGPRFRERPGQPVAACRRWESSVATAWL